MRVLVTGAGGPLGVNFTRSLQHARADIHIIGTDANRWHLPLSLCDTTYLIPLAKELDAYAAALEKISEDEAVDVIVPTHPVEVRAVARLVEEGRLRAKTALPRRAILDITDDKAATQEKLAAAGIAVPRTRLLHTVDDLHSAFAELQHDGGPVWVRGAGAPGIGIGGAALPCRSAKVAEAWIEHHSGWGRMAASEYLPGDNLSWMALFSRGTLVASGARERLEYVLPHVSPSGITGAPAVSRTLRHPQLEELGQRAVRAVDECPHGVYFVDMKGDREGQPMVTEINGGRCGTTIHFYTEAGINFPRLVTELAMRGELAPLPEGERVVAGGLYWVRTLDCGPVMLREEDFDVYPKVRLGGAS